MAKRFSSRATALAARGRRERSGNTDRDRRGELSRGKKALFSLIAVGLVGALVEGGLALLGVRPASEGSDPTAGFESRSRWFVEERGPDGQVMLATAPSRLPFFNRQRFARIKGPGEFRIFSLGESTTYGHPYSDSTSFNGWLRELLPAVAPGRRWELVNAGGISYGSERIVRLLRELIRYEPDLFVIYCGHNEFLERHLESRIREAPAALRHLGRWAGHSRAATLLQRAVQRAWPGPEDPLSGDPITLLETTRGPTSYTRASLRRDEVIHRFRLNLDRMVDLAQSVGARVMFVTPVSNLREASPFKSEHRAGFDARSREIWEARLREAVEDYRTNALPTNALATLTTAAALDDAYANLHYLRGRVLEKLGRYAEAKAAFQRALEEDVCPLRATTAVRQAVRDVSARRRVPLVDFEPIVEARSARGIPDAGMFLDHVHLTIEGYRLLALEIIRGMERAGWVQPRWDEAAVEQATRQVEGRIDTRAHSLALMNLCKTLGWAGKWEEAYRAGAQAARMSPDLARIHYEAGFAAQFSGRTEVAIEHYRRALELEPTLGDAHCTLAVLLEDGGRLEEAVEHYRLAVRYGKPKDARRDAANLQGAREKLAQRRAAASGR